MITEQEIRRICREEIESEKQAAAQRHEEALSSLDWMKWADSFHTLTSTITGAALELQHFLEAKEK